MTTITIIGATVFIIGFIGTIIYYIVEAQNFNKSKYGETTSEYARKIDRAEGEKSSSKREIINNAKGNISGMIIAKLKEIDIIKSTERQNYFKERDNKLSYLLSVKAIRDRAWKNIKKSILIRVIASLAGIAIAALIGAIVIDGYSYLKQTIIPKTFQHNTGKQKNSLTTKVADGKTEQADDKKSIIIDTINKELDNYINFIKTNLITTEENYNKTINEFAVRGTINSVAYFRYKKKYIEKVESDYKEWFNDYDIELGNKYIIPYNIKIKNLELYGSYIEVKKSTKLLVEKLKTNFDEELEKANIPETYVKPFNRQEKR